MNFWISYLPFWATFLPGALVSLLGLPRHVLPPALTRLLLQALVSALLSTRAKAAIANEYAPYREQS